MSPIKVLHGSPTPEELAAVVAVVSARAAAAASAPRGEDGPASRWADRARAMRRMPRPGRDAWRTSAWG
jgi:hypothetical protein